MTGRREFLIRTGGAAATVCAVGVGSAAEKDAGLSAASARPIGNVLNPMYVDARLDSRSISAENQTGARGGGGKEGHGRKGNAAREFKPHEKIVLADIRGPGVVRHIWMTTNYAVPEVARALRLEFFYDDWLEPSVSVPMLDFFGLPHGRRAPYYSALISVNEGLGLNCHMPMPFGRSVRVELTNESEQANTVYYQIDYTLEPSFPEQCGYLHATFRRENPTAPRRDFVIAEGFKGPGRFLGCAVGVRPFDKKSWYGEGEVKIYRDGDQVFPTYCGTGLEDYVGSAWNLGQHFGLYSGAPINIPADADAHKGRMPNFASFYRWHLPDPVMFSREVRVTIQQLGSVGFMKGEEAEFEAYKKTQITVSGWTTDPAGPVIAVAGIERTDDYCATAYVYCEKPQAVPRYSTSVALRDIGLLPYEKAFNVGSSDE